MDGLVPALGRLAAAHHLLTRDAGKMITNTQMKDLLSEVHGAGLDKSLPEDLQETVDTGWKRGPRGLLSPGEEHWNPVPTAGPQELMCAEIDLNDFRVDDDDLVAEPGTYLEKVTLRAFLFAGKCLERARTLEEGHDLHAVVCTSVDEDFLTHGSTVRFFLRRGELPARYEDLERFAIEAIALLGLNDLSNTSYRTLDELFRP